MSNSSFLRNGFLNNGHIVELTESEMRQRSYGYRTCAALPTHVKSQICYPCIAFPTPVATHTKEEIAQQILDDEAYAHELAAYYDRTYELIHPRYWKTPKMLG